MFSIILLIFLSVLRPTLQMTLFSVITDRRTSTGLSGFDVLCLDLGSNSGFNTNNGTRIGIVNRKTVF